MKKAFILFSFIPLMSLVACNDNGPTKATYEEFYQKTQEVEDHSYSKAVLTISFFEDMTQEGKTSKIDESKSYSYTWNIETNKFVADEESGSGHEDELSRTVKSIYKNISQEKEDSKDMGFQYFIEPFKVHVDTTEQIESRTIRTVQTTIYDKYGYMTYYLLEASANGTYKDQPISGVERTIMTVSYQ